VSPRSRRAAGARARLDTSRSSTKYRDFRELDWRPLASEIARLDEERTQLESTSDVLRELNARLVALVESRRETEAQLEDYRDRRSKTEQKQADAQALEPRPSWCSRPRTGASHEARFAAIDALRPEALGEHHLSVESCDHREQDMRAWLQAAHRRRGQGTRAAARADRPGR